MTRETRQARAARAIREGIRISIEGPAEQFVASVVVSDARPGAILILPTDVGADLVGFLVEARPALDAIAAHGIEAEHRAAATRLSDRLAARRHEIRIGAVQ